MSYSTNDDDSDSNSNVNRASDGRKVQYIMADELKTQPGIETTAQAIVHLQAAMDEFKKSPNRSDWSSHNSMHMAQQSVDALNFLIKGLVDSLPLQAYEIDQERALDIDEEIPSSVTKSAQDEKMSDAFAGMIDTLIKAMEQDGVEIMIVGNIVLDDHLVEQREEGQGGIDEPHSGYEYD